MTSELFSLLFILILFSVSFWISFAYYYYYNFYFFFSFFVCLFYDCMRLYAIEMNYFSWFSHLPIRYYHLHLVSFVGYTRTIFLYGFFSLFMKIFHLFFAFLNTIFILSYFCAHFNSIFWIHKYCIMNILPVAQPQYHTSSTALCLCYVHCLYLYVYNICGTLLGA